MLGVPHHLQVRSGDALCGVISPELHTTEIQAVNCLRCLKIVKGQIKKIKERTARTT